MKWHKSLIFKVILCCIILVLCLVGSVIGVLYRYQQSIITEMEEKSSEVLRAIGIRLTNIEGDTAPSDILESHLADLRAKHGVDAIILYDSKKKTLSGELPEETPLLEFGSPEEAHIFDMKQQDGGRITAYFQTFPLMVGQRQVGSVRIVLAIAPQIHLVKALRSKVLVSLILLFFGTIGALCYFIFQLLRPLRTMAAACEEIREGNLHELNIRPNAAEILTLEMKFNEMVEGLRTKAKMEQKLAQATRLSALGNLAAGVAHEIGNPLNGIKLTISHLKDLFAQKELDDESFEKYSETIVKEVNRLDDIVRGFLTLAKERELSLQSCKVDKLLRETVHLIEKEADSRRIAIQTDIRPVQNDIFADPQLMKSALLNILINAMDASSEGSQIHVNLKEENGHIVISIEDQGEGMSPDVLDRVFDPYFSTKSSGTGLGLSLTKNIIERHEGDIFIESEEGKGTVVTVMIPSKGH
ncbi:MAG: hypothetical protein Kow0099_23580 [Candidatus Abyssubacteria bacterium]